MARNKNFWIVTLTPIHTLVVDITKGQFAAILYTVTGDSSVGENRLCSAPLSEEFTSFAESVFKLLIFPKENVDG